MNSELPSVVITDIDHINGLQTARIFRERNIGVIGIANNINHYCAKTGVCDKIIESSTKTPALIDTLVNLTSRFSNKPLLIACQDTSVLLLSRNRKDLKPFYHIALPKPATVEMLMDKPSFYAYSVNNELPVAKFYLLHTKKDARDVLGMLRFPCTIKPPIKSPEWEKNTKIKAYKIQNEHEYFAVYDLCKDWADVLMVQEWVEGGDEDLYSCNCYFNDRNQPLVSFVSKKLRQYPPVTGNTSLGIECMDEEIREISLNLFSKVGYHGLGYVEIKKDIRDGKYYIIEPNVGRPTGRSALAEACGVEILYTMYCDKIGLPLPENIHQNYTGVKWIQIRTDLISSLYYWKKGELSIREWWKSLRGPKYFAVFSLKDPLPFLYEIFTGIKYIWNAVKFKKNYHTKNQTSAGFPSRLDMNQSIHGSRD